MLLELLTPIVKTYPAEAGKRSVDAGLQVLGGAGFCNEYVLQLYYRDIRITSIYEGTTGIQSLDLLGRKITDQNGRALKLLEQDIRKTLQEATALSDLAPYAQQLEEQLKLNRTVLGKLLPLVLKGEVEAYLSDATVYMQFFSNIVVGWLWLKMAITAQEDKAGGDFTSAKVHTMKFFFQYELSINTGLAEILSNPQRLTIAGTEEDAAKVFA